MKRFITVVNYLQVKNPKGNNSFHTAGKFHQTAVHIIMPTPYVDEITGDH
jgi:hypothetical protein